MEEQEIVGSGGGDVRSVRPERVVLQVELPVGSMVLIKHLSGKKARRAE